jgi:hypothetical protein
MTVEENQDVQSADVTKYVVLMDVATLQQDSTEYKHSIVEAFCSTPGEAYLKALTIQNIKPTDDSKVKLVGVYKKVSLEVTEV